MPVERYPAQLKVTRVMSTPPQNPPREEIYRGNSMHLQLIPFKLGLNKDSDRNYFYIVKRADLMDNETVEVIQAIYDLTDLETGKRDDLKYYGDKRAEFPLNNAKSLDGFLDRDLD